VTTDARNKITGTAVVTLSNGTFYRYEVKGKYNPSKDLSKLSLKAADDASKGSSVKLKNVFTTGATLHDAEIKYKLMGHKGTTHPD
jgi:hypothetical protein